MLYLLDKTVQTAKWNGLPLHEASSAIVKESLNGDFVLTLRYPITDSGVYRQLKEDMLIKAPVRVLGAQLFRIKKPVENDDSLDITAYHISDDVMKRSINPISVVNQACGVALSQLVQNAKTSLMPFSFSSTIMSNHTFNTEKVETLYTVLMDGSHSILGTWEGELVRDNFALSISQNRGQDRGVVITTHKNLKSFKRTKSSQSIVTRIHATSTFKPEQSDKDTTLHVTVDSPLIGSYPYIHEAEYENNKLTTLGELRQWANRKFSHDHIDKPTDSITIEAYELNGQTVHLGDTVTLKSRKHHVDVTKKAVAYEYNALTETYVSITFDDKASVGGTSPSSGIASAASTILGASAQAQETAIERAVANANRAFDAEFTKRQEEIYDGIEKAKADAEVYADTIRQNIEKRLGAVDAEIKMSTQDNAEKYAEVFALAKASTNLATEAKNIGSQAKADATTSLSKALVAKDEAISEAGRLIEAAKTLLSKQVITVSQEVDKVKGQLVQKVSSTDFDAVKQAVQNHTTAITQANNKIALKAEQTVVNGIKTTADAAYSKATTNAQSINQTKADLQVAVDSINGKVSKTDFDAATKRLTTAETTIQAQAGEITKRLTSTQVEAVITAKGYQTKANVDATISARGYATSTTVQQLVKETSNSFTRRLSETQSLIPNSVSHRNLAVGSSDSWSAYKTYSNQTTNLRHHLGDFSYGDSTGIYEGSKVHLYLYVGIDEVVAVSGKTPTAKLQGCALVNNVETWQGAPTSGKWSTTLSAGGNYRILKVTDMVTSAMMTNATKFRLELRLDNCQSVKVRTRALMVTTGDVFPDYWTKPIEDLTTVTAFNEVKETVGSHTRTIGEHGNSISQVLQTANGLVTRVASLVSSQNLVYDPTNFSKYRERELNSNLVVVGTNEYKLLRITQTGRTSNGWRGFQMPLHSQRFIAGEKLSYRVNLWVDALPDAKIGFEIKSGGTIVASFNVLPTKSGAGQIFTGTVTVVKTVTTTDDFGLHVWLEKNGTVAFGQLSIVRGDQPPSQFVDNTSSQLVATETLVQQHQGSYAIQNLTNAGSLISGINLGANGTNRITGKATHITNETILDKAVIKSAMVDKLKTANFEAGSVTAVILAANSVTAEKMVVDQSFFNKLTANDAYLKQLFAKSAFITQVQAITLSANKISGGILKATNNATSFNLNTGDLTFDTSSTIIFNRSNNALKRTRNGSTAFLHFNDSSGGGVFAGLGVTSHNEGVKSQDTGRFAGIRVFRDNDSSDQVELYGDKLLFGHAFSSSAHGIWVSPTKLKGSVDLIDFMRWCRTEIKRLHEVKTTEKNYNYNIWGEF